MFEIDKWKEIFATIWQNKLRTFLTMIGVVWGIFMLIILLGAGTGLQNGVMREMEGFATNSFYVWGQRTSIAYKGLKPGRYIQYKNNDTKAIREKVFEIEHLCPRNQLGGYQGSNSVVRKDKSSTFDIMGDYPEIREIESIGLTHGRFINQLDLEENRKVCVIGERVFEVLFEPGENPIGDAIKVNGVYFKVVGVSNPGVRSGREADKANETIYLPFTTFQQAFNYGNNVQWFAVTAKPGMRASVAEEKVKTILRKRHKVSPDDANAIGSWNTEEGFREMNNVFIGIKVFVAIVSILTLFAGLVGISNIMLITVKERTKEIGVRKAMGATPFSIVGMILQESVFLTFISGFLGLGLALLMLDGVNQLLVIAGVAGDAEVPFQNPEVSAFIAIFSIIMIAIAGLIAGFIPAYRASKIHPVQALSTE